jgi:hypothetical protein
MRYLIDFFQLGFIFSYWKSHPSELNCGKTLITFMPREGVVEKVKFEKSFGKGGTSQYCGRFLKWDVAFESSCLTPT